MFQTKEFAKGSSDLFSAGQLLLPIVIKLFRLRLYFVSLLKNGFIYDFGIQILDLMITINNIYQFELSQVKNGVT
ncbi:hypothetical protein D1AOALGA4SA_7019 [Olavius algarvensis Delta 1 endosymbiont]|nr:hypothetical protein D1AOALGA4SA_7019 [Olavius algarvensis Delta 1 endosymbiont]